MAGDAKDSKRSFKTLAPSENDPANRVFDEWVKLREAQGWTREAAFTELMIARQALSTVREADKPASEED